MRGGLSVNLDWSNGKPTSGSVVVDRSVPQRSVEVLYQGRRVAAFETNGETTTPLSF